jgi:uncharacterized protein YcaQ
VEEIHLILPDHGRAVIVDYVDFSRFDYAEFGPQWNTRPIRRGAIDRSRFKRAANRVAVSPCTIALGAAGIGGGRDWNRLGLGGSGDWTAGRGASADEEAETSNEKKGKRRVHEAGGVRVAHGIARIIRAPLSPAKPNICERVTFYALFSFHRAGKW